MPQMSPQVLEQVRSLYKRGLYVQAYHCGEGHGPLKSWTGTAARILAGRLAYQLGAPRLGRALQYLAWRSDPEDPEAIYYHAWDAIRSHGLLAAWEMQEKYGELAQAPLAIRADFCALRAATYGWLRDFEAADQWLSKAEVIAPDSPWIQVEKSSLLRIQDRYEDSLAAAQHALALRPWFRPGVEATAEALELLGRPEEALDLLAQAAERIESASVVATLAAIQNDLGRHDEARRNLERIAELAPLMEEGFAGWLLRRRSHVAYLCGDLEQGAEFARRGKDALSKRLYERLAGSEEGRRIQLRVPFVRQHHATCAPATLTSISRFWQMPADHLEIAEEICYDGTPCHSARQWAERNGCVVREFSVTWEDAVSLLDRGIPFALSLVRPAGAHLLAVIGYDSRLGSWLLRDPNYPHVADVPADEVIKWHPATGPRGLVFVPRDQAALLESLPLTDAPLYDHGHRLQTTLAAHDRPTAQQIYEAMLNEAPEHRLTREARLHLACYDEDETTRLRCVEQLLARFANDPNLLLMKLSCLQSLGRRDDRLELLKTLCDRGSCDPLFRQIYAQELGQDARRHSQAVWMLRRAMACRPDHHGFRAMAQMLWQHREFEKALALHRFAACLADKDEHLAYLYFSAARHVRQTEVVIAFLRGRLEWMGRRSSLPARTLFWAYEQLDRTTEAFSVLQQAMEQRPEDGDLLLFAADAHARYGDAERASALLDQARGRCRDVARLRTTASLARLRGDLPEALRTWREILVAQPLAMDAHRAVSYLLAATEGPTAARQHLEETARRFPHSYPVHQLWIEWLRDEPEKAEQVVRHLIEIDPADVWAHRELAIVLSRLHRPEEALVEAEAARQLNPADPHSVSLLGRLSLKADRKVAAREAAKEAIRLSVDNDVAIGLLMSTCRTAEQRREALAFVHEQLVRQVLFGSGLLAYRVWARDTLEPQELLAALQEALKVRPDLWETWSAVVQQLREMERLDEALDTTRRATDRFPLVLPLWCELARVHEARRAHEYEVEALQQALRICPDHSPTARQLATAHERSGDLEKAGTLLEQAIARDPLDAVNYGFLAGVLWKKGEREAAAGRLEHALRLEPGYDWAWDTLLRWGEELGRPMAAELARELTTHRGGEVRSWLVLARVLTAPSDLEERLAAVRRAETIDRLCVEAYDLEAQLLAEAGRFDEALAACRPAALAGDQPLPLRGREACIAAARGDLGGAVDAMRAVLRDSPDYAWGWSRLVPWLDALKRPQEALYAAEQLTRVDPNTGLAYAYRGQARLTCGDRAGAKVDFRRAFELDNDHTQALFYLFDLQFEDRELQAAAETLSRLQIHSGGPFVTARAVQLAAKTRDETAALKGLLELCTAELPNSWPLDTAVAAAMLPKAWTDRVRAVLESAMTQASVNPLVGSRWAKHFALGMKHRQAWKRLDELRKQGDVGWVATATYIEELVDAGRHRYGQARRFIRKYRAYLARDDRTWGSVAYALVTMNCYRQAADWTADWMRRPAVGPWALLFAVLSQRYLGREEEARQAGYRALSRPADHCTWRHALWLAVDEAAAGQFFAAADLLKRVPDLSAESPYYRFLCSLAHSMITAAQSDGTDTRVRFRRARSQLHAAIKAFPQYLRRPDLRRAYRRCVRRMAKSRGGLRAVIWAVAATAING